MNAAQWEQWLVSPSRRSLVMGVLNVTPDSFSDGGRFANSQVAISAAQQMLADGADLIDIGGESARPGSEPVPADEQLRRVIPIIHSIRQRLDIVVSIDTTCSQVARGALDAGANLINDISAGQEPRMLELAAQRDVAMILMHMQGTPKSMQVDPQYEDVVGEVAEYLRQRIVVAEHAGIRREKVLVDPGIGFGKGVRHNLELLQRLGDLSRLVERPMVIGTSRKTFIGRITHEPEPRRRLFGTAASVAWCVANHAAVVRVHDVREMSQVVRMIEAIQHPNADFLTA